MAPGLNVIGSLYAESLSIETVIISEQPLIPDP